MATYTNKYKLTKPDASDYYDIAIENDNMDKIEAAIETKVDKVSGKGLSDNNYTTAEKNKVANLPTNTTTSLNNKVDKVSGKGLSTNDYTTVEKNKVANVPSDTNSALATKVDKVNGKALSTNDYTTTDKNKVANVPSDTNAALEGKIPKVSPATSGNFATLNSDGTINDSGIAPSAYAPSSHSDVSVTSSNGIHGLKYANNHLQVKSGTSFVNAAVSTFNGRNGTVTPKEGDYNGTQVTYSGSVSGQTTVSGAIDSVYTKCTGNESTIANIDGRLSEVESNRIVSFNGRIGAVVPKDNDYTVSQIKYNNSQSLSTKLTEMNTDISGIKSTITVFDTTIKGHTNDISDINTTLTTHADDISDLQTTTETHTSDIASINTTLSTHTTEISDLESADTSIRSDISTITSDISDIESAVSSVFKTWIKKIYPVGAIYISTSSTSPSTLFPGTTWSRIQDKFLLAAGSTYTAGSTGGTDKHDHEYAHVLGEYYGALGIDNYGYTGLIDYRQPNKGSAKYELRNGEMDASKGPANINNNAASANTERQVARYISTAHVSQESNLPPYQTVYMWKRTA